MNLGTPELLVILVIVLLVFGGARLPKLARSLGQAQKEFKEGLSEESDDDEQRLAARWGVVRTSAGGWRTRRRGQPRAQDAATLTLAASAPHAVVDALVQGVLEAGLLHRTAFTDALGDFHANAIGGKKVSGGWVAQFPRAIQLVSIRISLVGPPSNRPRAA